MNVLTLNSLEFKKQKAEDICTMLNHYDVISISFFKKPVLAIHSGETPLAKGEIRMIDLLRLSKKDIDRLLGRKKALNIIWSKDKIIVGHVTRWS